MSFEHLEDSGITVGISVNPAHSKLVLITAFNGGMTISTLLDTENARVLANNILNSANSIDTYRE